MITSEHCSSATNVMNLVTNQINKVQYRLKSNFLASQSQIHSFYNLEKNDSHIAVGKLVGQVRSGKWQKKNDLWTLIRDQGLGILDSTLWIPDCRGGFQSQSVELGFWIPLFCGIPDSKALDFGFHKHSGIWIPLHRAISE